MNIAVVIPTYNRKLLLARALRSVYAQTRVPDQIIVIDDGSTDGTESMVKTDFPGVDYYYQDNAGVSAARNRGIKRSTSEWLAFLDSDDEWLPEKLELQELVLQQSPEQRVCHTEEIWIRNGKRVNPMLKHAKTGGWIFQRCLPLCAMSPSSIMIHRELFNQLGDFDETLPACEDYDFWLRITAHYPVLFIEQPQIVKYGGHEDQLSAKYWGMDRFRIQALDKLLDAEPLATGDRVAAVAMLKRKAEIFSKGARKRGKVQDAEYYESLINKTYD